VKREWVESLIGQMVDSVMGKLSDVPPSTCNPPPAEHGKSAA
jgi:hypothetical protein